MSLRGSDFAAQTSDLQNQAPGTDTHRVHLDLATGKFLPLRLWGRKHKLPFAFRMCSGQLGPGLQTRRCKFLSGSATELLKLNLCMPVCPSAFPHLSVWLVNSVEQELSLIFYLYSALNNGSPLCLSVGANTKYGQDKLRSPLKFVASISGLTKACVSWFIFSNCISWLIKNILFVAMNLALLVFFDYQ